MSHRFFCCFVWVLAGFVSINLQANQVLKVVTGEEYWPPYEWTENNQRVGYHIDLVRNIAASINLEVEFVSKPWNRSLQEFRKGKYKAITYLDHNEKNDTGAILLDDNVLHYAATGLVVAKYRKDLLDEQRILNSRKYLIGVQYGYTYGAKFDQLKYLNRYQVKTEKQLLHLLLTERVDAVAVYRDLFRFLAKKDGVLEQIEYLQPNISDGRPLFIGFNKREVDMAQRFAIAMRKFKQSEEHKQLLIKYELCNCMKEDL